MTGRHSMWSGDERIEIDVPVSGSENVMVPVIRAIVCPPGDAETVLLQRRADVSEPVFGCLEIPGGRWRSGESPVAAITREVSEETGVLLTAIDGISIEEIGDSRSIASLHPLVVVAGIDAAFPAIHVVVIAEGSGDLRGAKGETEDVQWLAITGLRSILDERPHDFVPSSRFALTAYIEMLDSA
ncbi:MAG: NUDIX hydrolase [Actinomycetia bacterium]|nr:NUDIX hydrolase [Actinomycetes bacterium]